MKERTELQPENNERVVVEPVEQGLHEPWIDESGLGHLTFA